jgi:hypothetical protein
MINTHSQILPVGNRIQRVLELAYRARLAVLLEGPTGIGKSEIIRQTAKDLGIDIIVLDLSLLEPPDLVGLPIIESARTRYATPHILPQTGAGILLLEELNRAESMIQQPALQLLTARTLHDYMLPEAWSVVAAINPENEDYQVNALDPALRARFLNLKLCANRENWLAWAHTNGVHPSIISLAMQHDRLFDDVCPRSWKYVSDLLKTLQSHEIADEMLLRDSLGGYLPLAWVEILLSCLSNWRDVDIDIYRLVREYHNNIELQTAIKRYKSEGRTDVLESIAYRVGSLIEGAEFSALLARDAFQLAAFEKLITDLPGDHGELLQEIFGANPMAIELIELKASDILNNYNTQVSDKIKRWYQRRYQRHRIWALATAVQFDLQQCSDIPTLRRSNKARAGLGELLKHLDQTAPLRDILRKLDITPKAVRR